MAWNDESCAYIPAPTITPPPYKTAFEESINSMGLQLSPVTITDAQGNEVTIYAFTALPTGATVCDAIVCESEVACE